MEPTPVKIEDLNALKGHYLRHSREGTIWKVSDCGKQGVTTYQAEYFGGNTFGPETCLTWGLVMAMYNVMVHAGEIDAKETH